MAKKLTIELEFDSSYTRSAVVLIEEDDGTCMVKRVLLEQLVEALAGHICREDSGICTAVGMPEDTYDVLVDSGKHDIIVIRKQSAPRYAMSRLGKKEWCDKIWYPDLVFIIERSGDRCLSSQCFAYKGELSYSAELYHFPFGNVSLDDGRICFGGMAMPNVSNKDGLEQLVAGFFSGAYNGDYYKKTGTTATGLSLSDLLDSLTEEKVSAFPDEILISTGKSLSDVLRERNCQLREA